MDPASFVDELTRTRDALLAPLVAPTPTPDDADDADGARKRLLVALVNELSVTELASHWIPTTREVDVKIAFARQAGDEASHFRLVASRLAALGVDLESFSPPAPSPLFAYLRDLEGTVARVAAGLFTLEALAYSVNERFIDLCVALGDEETVRIYRSYIQPDELAHQHLGRELLHKYATTPALRDEARAAVGRVAELAGAARAAAAARLGVTCLPGC